MKARVYVLPSGPCEVRFLVRFTDEKHDRELSIFFPQGGEPGQIIDRLRTAADRLELMMAPTVRIASSIPPSIPPRTDEDK